MKKIVIVILALFTLNMYAKNITQAEYAQLFKNYHACFILYDLNAHKVVSEYNPHHRCDERISPDSTFKIALSLMAFDQGIINQHTVFKWNGQKIDLPGWNQDQTPKGWLQYSVVWVSQQITPQLGAKRIQHYLREFNYGNEDFSGDPGKHNGLTHAWLSSSLKISAVEELNFLNAMLSHQLPLNTNAITATEENMYLGQLNDGAAYYGKTGAGRHGRNERLADPSLLRDGWFVGFVEKDHKQYTFVSNLTDKKIQATIDKSDGSLKPYGSQILKPITLQLLNEYFA